MTFRILVVEDDAFLALFTEKLLKQAGHSVVGFANKAEKAVSMFQQLTAEGHAPDLVIMDINLGPGADGIAAATQIRALDRHVAIVFFTAYADTGTLVRAEAVAPRGIIRKPATAAEILRAVENVRNSTDAARIQPLAGHVSA